MTQLERALLRERVQVLVLRHALEAALERVGALSGSDAAKDLTRLEHGIELRASALPDRAGQAKLTVLCAVEDALVSVLAAFDTVRERLDRAKVDGRLAA